MTETTPPRPTRKTGKMGRPPRPEALHKIPVSYKLPRWLVEWLREQAEPAAVLIEEALVKRHKLTPPGSGSRSRRQTQESDPEPEGSTADVSEDPPA